jgi:hemerythrin-like metal-binding protein
MPHSVQLPHLGIEEIDRQHAELIACLERLELWVGKGQGFPAALDAMSALNAYVAKHFDYEEEFLRQYGYEKLSEHIAEHLEISRELARLSQQVLDGGDVSDELIGMIRHWIVSHIGVEDLEYASFIAGRRDNFGTGTPSSGSQ